MAEYLGMNSPGLRVCRVSNPPLRERKRPPWGERNVWGAGKTHPPNPATRHKGLSSSPDFHELIGLFRVLHSGQQLLRLTMDTIHQQFVAVGDLVALQDSFSQPTQDTSFDGAKPQPVD